MIKLNDKKVLGAIYGVAIGDALGGPLEFMTADEIKQKHGEVREMIGGGWLNLKKGEITDDTQMTLDVALGIIDYPADPVFSVGLNMIDWNNYKPKDVGITCSRVITDASKIDSLKSEDWFKVSEQYHIDTNGQSAGNGALMRMVYPAIFYNQNRSVDIAVNLGKMTHWHEHSTLAITCYTKAIAEFVRTPAETEISYLKERLEFHMQDVRALQPDDLQPTGYVIDTLLCALNCIRDTQSYEDAVVKAVNLGGDADTIGAITGSLAGAIYGNNDIPQRWLECLDVGVKGYLCSLSDKAIDMNNKEVRTLNSIKKPRKTKVSKSREIVERMFRLYLVLINCEVASYREIFSKVHYATFKMFQRDYKELNDVGLINMQYSKTSKGYVHKDGWDNIVKDEFEHLTEDCVIDRIKFNFENYERTPNPTKAIEQLYRLIDLTLNSLYENFFDCMADKYYTEYTYCSQDMRNDYISGKVQIKIESLVEKKYYNKFPSATRDDYVDDMETLMRLGSNFSDETHIITIGEICQDYIDELELLEMLEYENRGIRDSTEIEFFWENGEPIDLQKDSEFYFYKFETGVNQLGKPFSLPEDTIPKEDWPEVKGHNWDED